MKHHRPSIILQLTFWFVILYIVMALLLMWFISIISQSVYRQTTAENLKDVVKNNLSYVTENTHGTLQVQEGFTYEWSGIFVTIYSDTKALLAGVPPINIEPIPEFENGMLKEVVVGEETYLFLDVYYPFDWDHGVWIRGMSALSDQTRLMSNLRRVLLMVSPLFLLLAFLGSFFIGRRMQMPLSKIIQSTKDITNGNDLSKRLHIQSKTREMQELVDTFDDMLGRLENSFEKEKQFTSDVSHELRTPLAVIKSACEYSKTYDKTREEWQDSLSMIEKNADHMKEMVDVLLALSRIDRGYLQDGFVSVNISPLLQHVIDDMKEKAAHRNIEIIDEIPDAMHVLGDEKLLSLTFYNLISNGIKYGKKDGHLWVSLYENKKEVVIRIKDDGIGIDETHLPFIFHRFYRVDEARHKDIEGFGLGLSLCHEIVQLHKGHIKVNSIPNLGSEFFVILNK